VRRMCGHSSGLEGQSFADVVAKDAAGCPPPCGPASRVFNSVEKLVAHERAVLGAVTYAAKAGHGARLRCRMAPAGGASRGCPSAAGAAAAAKGRVAAARAAAAGRAAVADAAARAVCEARAAPLRPSSGPPGADWLAALQTRVLACEGRGPAAPAR
ncbi:unnamed protein product, partial [Prorocentrum cordatum]